MARFTAGLLVGAAVAVIGLAALGAHAASEGGASDDDVGEVSPVSEPEYTVWDRLAACESTSNWHIATGNGFYGGLQFDRVTWLEYGGGVYAARADFATRGQQIEIATRLHAERGFQPWPACSRKLGLR